MSCAFLAQCHHVVCYDVFNGPLWNIKLYQHLVMTGIFVVVKFADDVRGVYAKQNANKISAEGNCRQFLQGVSV